MGADREIAGVLVAKGVEMLDAPVSGGEPKAIDGTLSFMVGGSQEVFDAFKDLSLRGLAATVSGLITMPGSLITAVSSPVAGKLYNKIGIRRLFLYGASLIFGGHFVLCFLTDTTPIILIALLFMIRQCGIGMLMMTSVTWGMSTLDKKYVSDGTAVISSLRTIAGAMGSALFVSLMTAAGAGRSGVDLIGIRTAFAGVAVLSLFLLILVSLKVGRRPGADAKGGQSQRVIHIKQ